MVPTVGLEPRTEDRTRFATLRLNHSARRLSSHSSFRRPNIQSTTRNFRGQGSRPQKGHNRNVILRRCSLEIHILFDLEIGERLHEYSLFRYLQLIYMVITLNSLTTTHLKSFHLQMETSHFRQRKGAFEERAGVWTPVVARLRVACGRRVDGMFFHGTAHPKLIAESGKKRVQPLGYL